jgi:hypothetical protein
VPKVSKRLRKLRRRTRTAVLLRIPLRLNARPDFIMIGAQKAGTTSLYAWLTEHPDVLAARRKEPQFFNRRMDTEPVRAYWLEFPSRFKIGVLRTLRRRPVVTGEASTLYLPDPRVPARVAELLPNVKLIAVLREPVDRAISNYWMEYHRGNEPLPLDEAMRQEPLRGEPEIDRVGARDWSGQPVRAWGYVTRSRYAEQLERWLQHFPREQLLVVEFDDLANDPLGVYRRVLDFIGVDPDVAPPPEFETRNAGSRSSTDPETVEWLREQFAEPNRALNDLVGIDYTARY